MTLPNRDQKHGGITAVGEVSQAIKLAMREGRNWERLSSAEAEALEMIAHKIGRILSGSDPGDREHWEDVAGYAETIMRMREVVQPSAGTGVLLVNPPWAGGGE